jgi:glycosyltransferase involved in cell wall biosynthesis
MGICEAYNRGAEKAQYDFLLFLHEDVLFETQDWGRILMNLLNTENIGCIGIAGADYIPEVPIGWWMIKNHCYSHITHANLINQKVHKFTFSSNSGLKKVNLIDGVFIACPKKNWLTIKFDERLKGYHAYDISFSLHTNVYFENYITNLISMKHFSQGKPSKEWLESLIQNRLNNRTHYKQNLIDTKLEFEMFTEFSRQLWHLDVSKREQTYYLLKFLKLKKLGFFNTLKAIKKIINILFY